jgi:hypothetical protein
MTRVFVEELLLFLLPFALFGLWLALSRRPVLAGSHWTPHVPWLVLAGLVAAIASLVYTGFIAPRGTQYVPAHMENGTFVPGKLD